MPRLIDRGDPRLSDIAEEWQEPAEATVTVYLYKSQEGEVFATTVVMSDKTILAGLAELIGNKEVTVREGDGMESSCPAISASR